MRASVIIPAFDAASTIDGCLQALLAQTCPRSVYEIIVVDDGSQDDTRERIARFASVRLIPTPHAGPAAARNRAAAAACGSILLFTDADCEPAPNWIEQMLAPFDAAPNGVAGVKGIYRSRQREPVARFVQLEYEEKYAHMQRSARIDHVDTYSAAYPRNLFLANGGFDEGFAAPSAEDQEFSFRLAKQGYRLVLAPGAVVYHKHVTGMRAYCQRKFRVGYGKARVHHRHPDKLLGDSHAPTTLRLQVGAFLALVGSCALAPFFPPAWWGVGLALIILLLSALPLTVFMLRRDPALGPLVPLLILGRAAALAAGLAVGTGGELTRGFPRQTKQV